MWNSFPTDAKTHEAAIAIARRCTWTIQAVLAEEERIEALREFYMTAREELTSFGTGPVSRMRSRAPPVERSARDAGSDAAALPSGGRPGRRTAS